jgi:hypothetical protein
VSRGRGRVGALSCDDPRRDADEVEAQGRQHSLRSGVCRSGGCGGRRGRARRGEGSRAPGRKSASLDHQHVADDGIDQSVGVPQVALRVARREVVACCVRPHLRARHQRPRRSTAARGARARAPHVRAGADPGSYFDAARGPGSQFESIRACLACRRDAAHPRRR